MKLVTYLEDFTIDETPLTNEAFGFVLDDHVYNFEAVMERYAAVSMLNDDVDTLALASIEEYLFSEGEIVPFANDLVNWASYHRSDLEDVAIPVSRAHLISPVPHPTSMRDGYAFRQHVEAARRNRGVPMIPEFDNFPIFYFTNHQAVTGPGEVEVLDKHLDKLDFELECAIVIGKEGKNIKASEADSYIAGYMVMNDWSARALQMEEMKLNLGPAKGKDFATSLGPFLVTPDELESTMIQGDAGNRYDLTMVCRVNGVEVSRGNLKDMSWTFAQIIEHASYGVTLYPGDVIGSGTVGTGCFLELNGSGITNQWLQIGDVVECEIEHLGTLQNSVVKGSID